MYWLVNKDTNKSALWTQSSQAEEWFLCTMVRGVPLGTESVQGEKRERKEGRKWRRKKEKKTKKERENE